MIRLIPECAVYIWLLKLRRFGVACQSSAVGTTGAADNRTGERYVVGRTSVQIPASGRKRLSV